MCPIYLENTVDNICPNTNSSTTSLLKAQIRAAYLRKVKATGNGRFVPLGRAKPFFHPHVDPWFLDFEPQTNFDVALLHVPTRTTLFTMFSAHGLSKALVFTCIYMYLHDLGIMSPSFLWRPRLQNNTVFCRVLPFEICKKKKKTPKLVQTQSPKSGCDVACCHVASGAASRCGREVWWGEISAAEGGGIIFSYHEAQVWPYFLDPISVKLARLAIFWINNWCLVGLWTRDGGAQEGCPSATFPPWAFSACLWRRCLWLPCGVTGPAPSLNSSAALGSKAMAKSGQLEYGPKAQTFGVMKGIER